MSSYNEAEPYKEETKKVYKIVISVFMDGTQNNLYNTKAKQEYLKKQAFDRVPALSAAGTTYSQRVGKAFDIKLAQYYEEISNKKDDSYENDYSNVARLYQNYKVVSSHPQLIEERVYVEGIATGDIYRADKVYKNREDMTAEELAKEQEEEYKADSVVMGVTFGRGGTGIVAKVQKACKLIAAKINAVKQGKKTIDMITIDVFGFSRGAAAARHLVYELNKSQKEAYTMYPMASPTTGIPSTPVRIPEQPAHGLLGAELKKMDISFKNFETRFLGLYDTVSSHAFFKKSEDIEDLKLDNIYDAQHILHLTAADEKRAFFPLIRLQAQTSTCLEKELPGVHSDIGGSYENDVIENINALFTGDLEDLRTRKEKLIVDGWYLPDATEWLLPVTELPPSKYQVLAGLGKDPQLRYEFSKENQLKISSYSQYLKHNLRTLFSGEWYNYFLIWNYYLSGTRTLSNAYSYIPLQAMAKRAKERAKVNLKNDLITSKFEVPADLSKIQKRIEEYVMDDGVPGAFGRVRDIIYCSRKELDAKIAIVRPAPPAEPKDIWEFWSNSFAEANKPVAVSTAVHQHHNVPIIQEPLVAEEYSDYPALKQKIEDHYMIREIRNKYLHQSSDCHKMGMWPTKDHRRMGYQSPPKEK